MRLIDLNSIQKFQEFLISKKNLICLTGAGISTASGIPDYRGENGSYKRGHKPMIHSEFVKSDISRKRYWTRSMAGYKYLAKAKPNKAHNSLVTLEKMGILKHIITQNVDSLHQKAGSMSVLDLHGRIEEIQCLSCQNVSSRTSFQTLLEEKNPSFIKLIEAKETNDEIRADGDMNVDHIDLTNFHIPPCSSCNHGILKPNVVFFGDNVPVKVSQTAVNYVQNADGLLVIGSSLEVFSAYRIVRMAVNEYNLPVAIINKGITRAEREGLRIELKSDSDCCEFLDDVVKQMEGSNS